MSVITAIVILIRFPKTCTMRWAYLTPLEPTVFNIAKHYYATTIVPVNITRKLFVFIKFISTRFRISCYVGCKMSQVLYSFHPEILYIIITSCHC